MVSNFRGPLRLGKRKAKVLDMHMHFCGFSQHSLLSLLYFIFFLSTWGVMSITEPEVEKNGDWSVLHPKFKVLGVGGRPFRPAHNRAISISTRGTHFQVMSKGTNLTTEIPTNYT